MHKARLNASEHFDFRERIEKSSKFKRFLTVRAKRLVSGACSGSNPIMVYFKINQQDGLDAGGRIIAF